MLSETTKFYLLDFISSRAHTSLMFDFFVIISLN